MDGGRFLALGAILVAVAVAGCFTPPSTHRPGPASDAPGTDNRSLPRLLTDAWANVTYNWTLEPGDGTYLAVSFRVEERTKKHTVRDIHARWNATRTYLVLASDFWDPRQHHPEGESLYWSKANTCKDDASAPRLDACPLRSFWINVSSGNRETLYAGTYYAYAAAFGAEEATIRITMSFEHPVEVLWVDRGTTDLLTLPRQDAASGSRNVTANRTLDDPYLAGFARAGNASGGATYHADGPGSDRHRFRRVSPFRFEVEEGFLASSATTTGVGGNWTFAADYDPRNGSRIAPVVVGILEDAPFVTEGGRFAPMGPGVGV